MTQLGTKETAKAIRSILKVEFHGVKFSVRGDNYSMGSSIRISWIDGPTSKQVESKIGHLSGGDSHYNSLDLNRNYSAKFLEAIRTEASEKFPGEIPEIVTWDNDKNAGFKFMDFDLQKEYWYIQTNSIMVDGAARMVA